ncbi:MAG: hypothetical protein JNL11_02105 [Bdellovibrionaceae bacterium]|nr:hypothetical protein [Pseudobdellovibrionaceae bacterium]
MLKQLIAQLTKILKYEPSTKAAILENPTDGRELRMAYEKTMRMKWLH